MSDSIAAHEFLHGDSIGNKDNCREVGNKMGNQLKQWKQEKVIAKAQGKIIHGQQGAEGALIFFDYNKLTNSTFPFVYVAVQINNSEYIELVLKYMETHGYLLIDDNEKEFNKYLS